MAPSKAVRRVILICLLALGLAWPDTVDGFKGRVDDADEYQGNGYEEESGYAAPAYVEEEYAGGNFSASAPYGYDDGYYSDMAAMDPESDEREPAVWSAKEGSCPDPSPDGTCTQPPSEDAYDEEKYDDHDPLLSYDNCQYLDDSFQEFDLNGTEPCNLVVSGADVHADLLSGGLDGLYELVGCFEGKPLYLRKTSPQGEDRMLFFNPYYGDWEFSIGDEPNEDQLVLWGDFGFLSPYAVPSWHLAAALNSQELKAMPSDDEELYYIPDGISVRCQPSRRRVLARLKQQQSGGLGPGRGYARMQSGGGVAPGGYEHLGATGGGGGGAGAAAVERVRRFKGSGERKRGEGRRGKKAAAPAADGDEAVAAAGEEQADREL